MATVQIVLIICTDRPTWLLLMAWHSFVARPSAAIMLNRQWLNHPIYIGLQPLIKLGARKVTSPSTRCSYVISEFLFSQPLQWRHNGCAGVSNHWLPDCLLNRLFRRRSNKTSKLRVTGLCGWNSPVTGDRWPVNSPHKGSVTRKMISFDNVIMNNAPYMQRTLPGLIHTWLPHSHS